MGGRTCVGTDYTNNKGYCLKGFIKSVRVYDRVLTDQELAQNREIDEARFGTVRIPGPGSVTVAESLHGCVGREHSGVYVADGWTFSSGIRTNTLVGISWACDGCTVQTWNSETREWGDATELSVHKLGVRRMHGPDVEFRDAGMGGCHGVVRDGMDGAIRDGLCAPPPDMALEAGARSPFCRKLRRGGLRAW